MCVVEGKNEILSGTGERGEKIQDGIAEIEGRREYILYEGDDECQV